MNPSLPASKPGFKTVFRASGLSPLHMLQMVAFAFFVAGLGLAWHLAQAPSQALTAPSTKIGWAAFLAAVATAGPVGALLYGRRLAARVEVSDDGKQVRVRDANIVGARWHTVNRSDLVIGEQLAGDVAGEQALAPPRLEIAVKGGRNFIVPLQRRSDARGELIRALRG